MTKLFIIVNPNAGNRDNSRSIKKIKDYYVQKGLDFDLYITRRDYGCKEIIQKNFNTTYSQIVAAGGDGTINEVVNALPDFSLPMGIIPLGKGNDYVKNFRGAENLKECLNSTLSDEYIKVSMAKANDRYFLNGVGAGFDGEIIHNMANYSGMLSGHLAYYYHVIKILGSYKEKKIQYKLDDKLKETKVLLMIAGFGKIFGGGFKLLPTASPKSDRLSVCIIREIKPIMRFIHVAKLNSGTHGDISGVTFHSVKKMEILNSNIKSQIDGEVWNKPPLKIHVSEQKLKVTGLKTLVN